MSFKNKAKGSLYGLYIGDAFGAPLEFTNTDCEEEVREYLSGGAHSVKKGEFTDDTSMTLALMDSLTNKGFDLKDQMNKYLSWFKNSEYSTRTYCFDIGISTQKALEKFEKTKNPIAGDKSNASSGNGSMMRYAPVPLMYYSCGINKMIEMGLKSSITTHQSPIVLESLTLFTLIYKNILDGKSKEELFDGFELEDYKVTDVDVIEISKTNYKEVYRYDLNPTGYVLDSLHCALWAFYKTNNFEEAIIKAINLGGDSDTIGAITGQIAGAYYGYDNIPEYMVDGLYRQDILETYTKPFLDKINPP